ncbi:HAMP domain-containing sensor histidine kinase [Spirochaeta africana]|uniref:histidine kinase n=1 Tax=Spirochaeta africana (strain ATCC 700263 / DSM 8902 / Z-7692) TaxID=889378 RepID=H9UGV0_SPIAZ|nr:HAMP domain-containing sensor histidine kinase [Spirochaeta africana]AFG36743.1 signal transduction histidine kinase [Spirochaeta africana DSM 8902]
MSSRDPIRSTFLIVGAVTMIMVIAAGFWSNLVYERQYQSDHRRELQRNADLAASVLERFAEPNERLAFLTIRDMIDTWDARGSHRHRIVVENTRGEDILVFPYNIGVLAHAAESPYRSGLVTLYTTEPVPYYPSQLYVLGGLGLLLLLVIWLGMQLAGRTLQQPLHTLAAAANEYAGGNLAHRTSPDEHPIVGEVAATMNQMAAQLQSRIATILAQQQELEALLGSLAEGIIVLDRTSRVVRMNRVAAMLFDADPDAVEGKPLLQVVRSSRLEELVRTLHEQLQPDHHSSPESPGQLQPQPQQHEIELFGNEPRIIQVQAAVYQSNHKQRTLLVLHDITAIRRLETVRRDFVANVSHELKTPITSIGGFVETILEDIEMPRSDLQRFLGIVHTQSQRLQAIIEDLLSLSRIEEHGRELPRSEVSLAPLLQGVVDLTSHLSSERGIRVRVDNQGPAGLTANANLLEQALLNLVQNAIKYSPAGAEVVLRSRWQDSDAILEVQDSGTGIPQQDLPRLFERFYRVDRARSRQQGGTGLGLAIVKHIALVHGGSVAVDSTLGRGSTFRIVLPQQSPAGSGQTPGPPDRAG